ncbi:MAG: PD40 domain-containing protein [Verrucomicrobiae bacterium]|nr:PD40 domain-containing protein [Verrucomicrobiae bacterium]
MGPVIAAGAGLSACRVPELQRASAKPPGRLMFTSRGRTVVIQADGTGERVLSFQAPDQVTWQPGPFLSDGRRLLVLSMEARRDGPGRPFSEYYHQTPTHIWLYDPDRETLMEIVTMDRLAVFYTPALLLSDQRLLVQVVQDAGGQILSMNLDGSDAREFTRLGEGLPYGLSLSPDGRRVAYHLASPTGYQIWTSNTAGSDRTLVAAHPDHLYFGPAWSPNGEWLAFSDCHFRGDPGHDWCDVVLARPDGAEQRVLTPGQAMWFAATYGNPQERGGGSNLVGWTRDGQILFPRRLPGSRVAWEYQAGRPDTDHFNRDYKPELACGGVEICRLDPTNGRGTRLTQGGSLAWDFRAVESPDGSMIAFCRAGTGGLPALWVMDSNGGNERLLTRGLEGGGAEHPRWMPEPS